MYTVKDLSDAIKCVQKRSNNSLSCVAGVDVYSNYCPYGGNITVDGSAVCTFNIGIHGFVIRFRVRENLIGSEAHHLREDMQLSEITEIAKEYGIPEDVEAIFTRFIDTVKEEAEC